MAIDRRNWPNKYRPTDLEFLVGQDEVRDKLEKYNKEGKLKQTILITGTTGAGKTTLARIIAKMISPGVKLNRFVTEHNCGNDTGINEIRKMIEASNYPAMQGGKKVFILDEVHALSSQATNALLKPTEEPPSHVTWILATNEPHKLPPTLLNRGLLINLRPPTYKDIVKVLKRICEKENVFQPYDKHKPILIKLAKICEGDFRRAINALDLISIDYNSKMDEGDIFSAIERSDPNINLEKSAVRLLLNIYSGNKVALKLNYGESPADLNRHILNLNKSVMESLSGKGYTRGYGAELLNKHMDKPPSLNTLAKVHKEFVDMQIKMRSAAAADPYHILLVAISSILSKGD